MNSNQKLATIFFSYQEFSTLIDLNKYNLTKNQHRIIFILATFNNVNIKKILVLLSISKQAANVAIRDLISRDLVKEQRSTKDKRIKFLLLTDDGNHLNNDICNEQIQLLDKYFSAANDDWQGAMQKMADEYVSKMK